MIRLRDLLQDRELFSVQRTQSVADVARSMAALNVGAILVLCENTLSGIFSERDLMTRVVVARRDPEATRVDDVMTTDLATIQEEATVEAAMELMQQRKCRHLPVMRGSDVVGLISMRDLMSVELERKTEEIQQMRAYIAGNC
jgi:Predicted signal-transduction protein containing cAMP-binding and CBS domains